MVNAQDGPAHSAPDAMQVSRATVDRDVFAQLYQAHAPAMLAYLLRRTGERALAEDLLSETFLRALKRWKQYRDDGVPVRFWLYRIATNLANSAARRRRLRQWILGDPGVPPASELYNSVTESTELSTLREQTRRALARLSADDQSILTLRFMEDLAIDDVARILRCPAGTVQSRTARARERLRRILEKEIS